MRSLDARYARPRTVGSALLALALLAVLILLSLAADAMLALTATAAEDRHRLRGEHVAVYNLAGEVAIEAGAGREVEVWIERGGRDGDELEVATGAIRGRQTLRVVYPANRIVYRTERGNWNTSMNVDEDGTFNDRGGNPDWLGGRRRVQISNRGSGLEAHADLRIAVPDGQRLDVFLGVGRASVSNVDGVLLVDVASASVSATGTRGRLTLDSGSGDLAVENAMGDISLDTGSGDVSVSHVKAGKLHVDTGSGTIRGRSLVADVIHLDTGSGDVAVEGVVAPTVLVDTGSGSVHLDLAADVEDVTIDTGSGSVTVLVPRGLGAEFAASTGSGGIETDLPFDVIRRSRDALRGRIGDGRGRMAVETGSGSIRLASSGGSSTRDRD